MVYILRATTSASWPLLAPSGCHLGGLGGCILILWEIFSISGARWGVILATRGHPGRPWEKQDGHEVVGNMMFIDFGVKHSKTLKISLFFGLDSRRRFVLISVSKFRVLGIRIRGFLMEGIAKINFSPKSFFSEFRGLILWFVGGPWQSFFWFFCVLKTIPKTCGLLVVSNEVFKARSRCQ